MQARRLPPRRTFTQRVAEAKVEPSGAAADVELTHRFLGDGGIAPLGAHLELREGQPQGGGTKANMQG